MANKIGPKEQALRAQREIRAKKLPPIDFSAERRTAAKPKKKTAPRK